MAKITRHKYFELVEVLVPAAITVGEPYSVQLKFKNTALLATLMYHYRFAIGSEEETAIKATKDMLVKAGETATVELSRVAKNSTEQWNVQVYRSYNPSMDKYFEPQFASDFSVPGAVPPPNIEVVAFEIINPANKQIFTGEEFTVKAAIKNRDTVTADKVVLNVTQYRGDPANPANAWSLGSITYENVPAGQTVETEATFTEKSGAINDYNICASFS